MQSKPENELGKKGFAKKVWPRIKDLTKFVEVPESQGTVTYTLPSGKVFATTLKWYAVTNGPSIFAHYDDENDVCYIGKFIER